MYKQKTQEVVKCEPLPFLIWTCDYCSVQDETKAGDPHDFLMKTAPSGWFMVQDNTLRQRTFCSEKCAAAFFSKGYWDIKGLLVHQ